MREPIEEICDAKGQHDLSEVYRAILIWGEIFREPDDYPLRCRVCNMKVYLYTLMTDANLGVVTLKVSRKRRLYEIVTERKHFQCQSKCTATQISKKRLPGDAIDGLQKEFAIFVRRWDKTLVTALKGMPREQKLEDRLYQARQKLDLSYMKKVLVTIDQATRHSVTAHLSLRDILHNVVSGCAGLLRQKLTSAYSSWKKLRKGEVLSTTG